MPRMSNTRRAIAMTRSGTWNTVEPCIKSEDRADFCLNRCPHADKPCKGDCPEMKDFRKNHKELTKGVG